jgi:RNA polymerase sigma-70 factor, ECF subfamily
MEKPERSVTDTTAELVRKAAAGDANALSGLLRMHGPNVERSLQIGDIYRSMIDAADVMQVTYLEAFMQIGTFDVAQPERFEGWLRQIAQNNLRDAIRGFERQKQPPPRNRVNPVNRDDSMVDLYDLLGEGTSATPSRAVRKNELCGFLDRAIEALPERYGKVVRMYDIEGKSIAEVAEAVGKSAGAVHMMRARAHDRLREEMGSSSRFFSTGA